jgi:hypothetical protein
MSSGVPIRPNGTVSIRPGRSASVNCSTSKNDSVATMPGEIAFTRMPRGATSAAIVAVRFSSAAFAAAYGPVLGAARMPAPDATLMIAPPRAIR